MSEKSRSRRGIAALVLAMACTACGATASQPSSAPPTPSPTPAGGEHQFVVPGLRETVTVTLPPGWSVEDRVVSRTTADEGTLMAVSAWVVKGIYGDPCHWTGTFRRAGRTAEALADALLVQPSRDAREATVDVGGRTAQWVVMSVPDDLDLASCDGGEFRSWAQSAAGDNARSHEGPGQVDEVYVLDVGGRRVVIDASYFSDASSEEIGELHRVVQSLQISRD